MTERAKFDHAQHLADLCKIRSELLNLGKECLVATIDRVIAIHQDACGRVAQAQQQTRQLRQAAHRLTTIADVFDNYVGKPAAPWIEPGCDLYPRVAVRH
jgi:hypothetical protein